jgi:hypothetical protein
VRIDRRFLGWGIFLIAVGIVPLAVRAGWLSADQVAQAWRFWPLILVGFGVAVLARYADLLVVGTLVTSLTLGLAVGGGLAATGAIDAGVACSSGPTPALQAGLTRAVQASAGGSLGSTAAVELTGACGPLIVETASGAAWSVVSSASDGHYPIVDSGAGQLRVSPAQGVNLTRSGDRSVTVVLPTDPTLDLHVTASAGRADLTLSGARLSGVHGSFQFGDASVDLTGATVSGPLELSFDFGSGSLDLPQGQTFSGSITSNFGSLSICAPSQTGLRFTTSQNFGSHDFASAGLVDQGGVWQTPGFENAASRITLQVSSNFGSIDLNRQGGC